MPTSVGNHARHHRGRLSVVIGGAAIPPSRRGAWNAPCSGWKAGLGSRHHPASSRQDLHPDRLGRQHRSRELVRFSSEGANIVGYDNAVEAAEEAVWLVKAVERYDTLLTREMRHAALSRQRRNRGHNVTNKAVVGTFAVGGQPGPASGFLEAPRTFDVRLTTNW